MPGRVLWPLVKIPATDRGGNGNAAAGPQETGAKYAFVIEAVATGNVQHDQGGKCYRCHAGRFMVSHYVVSQRHWLRALRQLSDTISLNGTTLGGGCWAISWKSRT